MHAQGGDPALLVIEAYRAAMAKFNRLAPDGDGSRNNFAVQTYAPKLEAIRRFDQPAETCEGAKEMLRLALEMNRDGQPDIVDPAIRAVLGYLEKPS